MSNGDAVLTELTVAKRKSIRRQLDIVIVSLITAMFDDAKKRRNLNKLTRKCRKLILLLICTINLSVHFFPINIIININIIIIIITVIVSIIMI